jgi:GMP reductase
MSYKMNYLNYDDISLVPKKCVVDSREECSTEIRLGKHTFEMPVVAANMASVVDIETCKFFCEHNWFYIMHRFGIDIVDFCNEMKNSGFITSISVGVNGDSYRDLKRLKDNNCIHPDYITIDVAHGWSDRMRHMIEFIKDNFSSYVIAGNVVTKNACEDLKKWGADCVKICLAGGKVCTTRYKTGFYIPPINVINECSNVDVDIIADGGIQYPADITKALCCGADMVMVGSLFAGFDQSAGDVVMIDNKHFKEYYGSASQYNKKHYKNIEGKKILVEYKGDMKRYLNELKQDLQSSISYAGGRDLSALKTVEIINIK